MGVRGTHPFDDEAPVRRAILVVDDLPANLLAIEAALAPLERAVIAAHSGTEALAHLLEHEFALVVLDVQMADMDGLETASWIRSRARHSHLPILFATAFNPEDPALARAYELGAVDVLAKPLKPEILRAKARTLADLYDEMRANATRQERATQEELARLRHELALERARNHRLVSENARLARRAGPEDDLT